jgi:hypothetical protein
MGICGSAPKVLGIPTGGLLGTLLYEEKDMERRGWWAVVFSGHDTSRIHGMGYVHAKCAWIEKNGHRKIYLTAEYNLAILMHNYTRENCCRTIETHDWPAANSG